ncbi:MAG: alpha-glucosidase [Thermoanaerobaculia bacterium]|jgi:hypothetical protein|nr:alpha-glucosidase [Thermoanaerobaculia bacterium]
MNGMSITRKLSAHFLFLLVLAIPARGQWTALGNMPPPAPAHQGNSLRFANGQAVAVMTVLAPDVVRVRISQGSEGRDHSYAVINRNLGDSAAAFAVEAAQSTITTATLRVTIRHAPFRISFATRDGKSLDEDDAQLLSTCTAPFGTRAPKPAAAKERR